jgi:hypothetical protein
LGVDVDDRRSLPVKVARSRAVVDANEIADDELGERVDRPHRVEQVEASVYRSSDRRQVQIQLAGSDRVQQQAVGAAWR